MAHSLYDTLPEQRIIHDAGALRGYFDPLRQRMMQAISAAPMTVHELARRLDVPFTRLYYHMHFLERHGFIQQVDRHSYGGAVEQKVYFITAKTFVIDRRLLTVISDDEDDTLEAVLQMTLDDTRADIRASARQGSIDLSQSVPHPQAALLTRNFFHLSPEQAMIFQERLKSLLAEMLATKMANEEAEDSTFYALMLAFYPSALAQRPSRAADEG